MSKSMSSSTRRILHAGLAGAAASLVVAAVTTAPAFAAAGTLSLSSTGGASGGGNTLIATFATTPTSPTPTTFTTTTTAQFVAPTSATTAITCPATYPTPGTTTGGTLAVTGTGLKLLGPTRLGITVPAGVVHPMPSGSTTASSRYMLCVYNGAATASVLVASAPYSVGAKPTIASTAAAAVSPATGPALGGTTITVTGTNFVANTTAAPNNTTATLGGVPLRDLTVAANGNSFTATTPAHAASDTPALLTVTTPGGTVSTLGVSTTQAQVFTYTNGIVASPNTAANTKTTTTDIDIQGVGFTTLNFATVDGTQPTTVGAHVYLSRGQYNATGSTGSGLTGTKANGPLAECTNVLVVTDTEVLCSLNVSMTLDSSGVAAITRTAAISTTSGSPTIHSLYGTFTQADVGAAITVPSNTEIAALTTILSVTNATTAVLSANASASSANVTGTISYVQLAPTSGSIATASGSPTLTGASGDFTSAEIGQVVTGTGIPANTYITAVPAGGATATMSANALSTNATDADVKVTAPVPLTNGAYQLTVVSNGVVGANISDTAYTQTNVSSGSTFTVAPY